LKLALVFIGLQILGGAAWAQNHKFIGRVLDAGTLAIFIGNLPAGGEMTAYFAQLFESRDGKIYRQRNYDCFEPFN